MKATGMCYNNTGEPYDNRSFNNTDTVARTDGV